LITKKLISKFYHKEGEPMEEIMKSRRKTLKKVGKIAAFAVPTLVTFQASTLKVAASTGKSRGRGGAFPGQGNGVGGTPGNGGSAGTFPGNGNFPGKGNNK
jgi:hypothetical protein